MFLRFSLIEHLYKVKYLPMLIRLNLGTLHKEWCL
nr:MAG TPA: hypothetical protein [Caudoviricetes sp.]